MNTHARTAALDPLGLSPDEEGDLLPPLLARPVMLSKAASGAVMAQPLGVVIGELLALTEDGRPLVRSDESRAAGAVVGRTAIDLHAVHIGRPVVLIYEQGDLTRPIVLGVLRGDGWPAAGAPGHVEVDADGQRLVVTASEELVLRCGKASITLTSSGRVSIDGTYVVSRSTGTNRIKGGSVQLN